jgi:hypothetical protein
MKQTDRQAQAKRLAHVSDAEHTGRCLVGRQRGEQRRHVRRPDGGEIRRERDQRGLEHGGVQRLRERARMLTAPFHTVHRSPARNDHG